MCTYFHICLLKNGLQCLHWWRCLGGLLLHGLQCLGLQCLGGIFTPPSPQHPHRPLHSEAAGRFFKKNFFFEKKVVRNNFNIGAQQQKGNKVFCSAPYYL